MRTRGFTLVELMVALALGMLLTVAMTYAYLSSKTAAARQHQLSDLQRNVRDAFDFLANDVRMLGHVGCYTGSPMATPNFQPLPVPNFADDFAVGVEGWEYRNDDAGRYTLASAVPAEVTDAAGWTVNAAGTRTLPLATIAGSGHGLAPGSDVLVLRIPAGRPVRLTANANVGTGKNTLAIETGVGESATCADGSTAQVSGFCPRSYGLVASCSRARVFRIDTLSGGTLTLTGSLGSDPIYEATSAEVFPMRTVVYYVRRAANGTALSLYRRIFDGDTDGGIEQELVEGAENLQVLYGMDTTATADGVVDTYVPAGDATLDWSRVVAVRVGLLLRSTTRAEADLVAALPTHGVVNDVDVTYPTGRPAYDRRVFTTTIAVRNRIAYFPPKTE